MVRGGEKPNVIPAEAECQMIFRIVEEPEAVRARLEAIIRKHDGEIYVARGNPPQHMIVPDGEPSTVVAFNTDVPHLGNLGKPLLFGPGSILDAHTSAERVSKRELEESVELYMRLVKTLLASANERAKGARE